MTYIYCSKSPTASLEYILFGLWNGVTVAGSGNLFSVYDTDGVYLWTDASLNQTNHHYLASIGDSTLSCFYVLYCDNNAGASADKNVYLAKYSASGAVSYRTTLGTTKVSSTLKPVSRMSLGDGIIYFSFYSAISSPGHFQGGARRILARDGQLIGSEGTLFLDPSSLECASFQPNSPVISTNGRVVATVGTFSGGPNSTLGSLFASPVTGSSTYSKSTAGVAYALFVPIHALVDKDDNSYFMYMMTPSSGSSSGRYYIYSYNSIGTLRWSLTSDLGGSTGGASNFFGQMSFTDSTHASIVVGTRGFTAAWTGNYNLATVNTATGAIISRLPYSSEVPRVHVLQDGNMIIVDRVSTTATLRKVNAGATSIAWSVAYPGLSTFTYPDMTVMRPHA